MSERAQNSGVYFARSDLAGLGARFAIVAIDLIAFCLALIVGVLMLGLLGLDEPPTWPFWAPGAAYFSLLTRAGTLGYRLLGYRLVALNGEAPTYVMSFGRFVVSAMWFGVDTFWLLWDENRQTFRDKLAGTYVVRRDASPLGRGRISYSTYFLWGFAFIVPEVQRDSSQPPPSGATHVVPSG